MLIDTHAHYDDAAFDEDREQLINELGENNIVAVDAGASFESSIEAARLAEKYKNIFALAGVHPDEVDEMSDERLDIIEKLTTESKVIGIGEIGLDYHTDFVPHETQKYWFVKQLELAEKLKLPVCIHSRDAAQDTFDIVKEHHDKWYGGVLHCYSYSPEMAAEYVKFGMYFGIGGVVTFKNAKKLKETVSILPMESIVLETDCPYLAPTPHRGERNSSLLLPLVIKEIAEIKGITEDKVLGITTENAYRLYPKLNG